MSPETATVSIAAPADLVFTVSSTDAATTITALKNGSATVNAENYTYSAGTLTIKSTYLSGLPAGAKIFTLVMSSGTSPTITVTVTA